MQPILPPAPAAELRAGKAETCEFCGLGPLLHRHCKIVCMNCGAVRDCSDP